MDSELKNAVTNAVLSDVDASRYLNETILSVEELANKCDLSFGRAKDDDYTDTLVQYWVSFSPYLPGGSVSDYCADAVVKAFRQVGVVIRLIDMSTITELRSEIASRALYADREIERLRDAGVEIDYPNM